ncbi:glycoside hydrolase family 125 protein [Listeria costaricensis]|uniref:glycoside hydrolase family 125 protein n=1 Tax=Listeria costaricensis TaxID=2026604 RepID=UPI000C08B19F
MVIQNRQFIQSSRERIFQKTGNEKLAHMYEKCMTNTLDTTIKYREDGATFIVTGDIPAMWLRDSVCQIRPFLYFAKENEEIQQMLIGLLREQERMIAIDPYANAFNETASGAGHQNDLTEMLPEIWERKYEIDSLCYPLQLAYFIWKFADQTAQFDNAYLKMIHCVLDVWQTELRHETDSPYRFERLDCATTDTLPRSGKGNETAYTGLLWSGFRPSDDACEYGYLIPSNLFAIRVLAYTEEILATFFAEEIELLAEVTTLRQTIEAAIEQHAIYNHAEFGEIYAYEVDGLGNQLLMDDANVPSLLALPFLGIADADSARYKQTRRFLLSQENPFYQEGEYAAGIGSPHTPLGYIWPIALSIQGLTATEQTEKEQMMRYLLATDAGTEMIHESFDPNQPENFTREWFSWANMMFCELALDLGGYKLDLGQPVYR